MSECKPNWHEWKTFFEGRALRAMPAFEPGDSPATLPPSLARSLAIFQLGESGGGSVVDQARRSRLAGVDNDYAESVRLFVREENRHADILAKCVKLLRGRLIARNWTALLFVRVRRLLGLRFKILVLLAAEVVGLCYYHLLAAKIPDHPVGRMLAQLVEDERAHLRFHCCFLNRQTRNPLYRLLFVIGWRTTMLAAALAVFVDHYPAIRDMGIGSGVVWRRWMLYCRLAESLVVAGPEPREALQTA